MALKAAQMTASSPAYLRFAGVPPPHANMQYTMHSFRVGRAVSRSLAGMAVAEIMSLVGWKSAGVAQRNIGATPPHQGDKGKRESHEHAYIDATRTSCPQCQNSRNCTQHSHEKTPKVGVRRVEGYVSKWSASNNK